MVIAGIVLCVVAVILFFMVNREKGKITLMKGTETSTAKSLHEIAQDVSSEIGGGSFRKITEVKGKIETTSPLKAEFSGIDCVYFSNKIIREYEETRTVTDSEGHRRQETVRGSETVASNERSIPFLVRDTTGTIEVDPAGAQIQHEKVHSRFDSQEVGGTSFSIGSFKVSIPPIGSGRRTLGYRYEEYAVPVERNIYVLGEASDIQGTVKILKPEDPKVGYIISLKSEEELIASSNKSSMIMTVVSGVCAVGGIVCIILGIIGV